MTESHKSIPRPEAQPFNIKHLSKSQNEAMIALLQNIAHATNNVPTKEKQEERNPRIITMEDDRPNRIVLLSGGRGSGKTSVLYTLIKAFREVDACHSPCSRESCAKSDNPFWNGSDRGGDICSTIKKDELQKRVVWLQTLDMETLPSPTNLLAAIFSRIGEAVDRFREFDASMESTSRFRFDMYPDGQDTMLEFARLQQDVALAWNGNLEQRAAAVDPDVYAVEVLRTEHSRFKLNKRLSWIMDNIAKKFLFPDGERSIFILPVDDFDMNPDRCLELIRLLRLISVPRLFTIILGDDKIIRDVVNINVVATLATVRGDTAKTNIPGKIPYDECRIGHEISANAIRKMFPESHTIQLEPMEWNEVFKHKPNGGNISIEELLGKIPVEINTGFQLSPSAGTPHHDCAALIGGMVVRNIRDMFTMRVNDIIAFSGEKEETEKNEPTKGGKNGEDTRNSEEMVYITPIFLKMHSRHFQDAWRCLRRITAELKAPQDLDGPPPDLRKGFDVGIELAYTFFKQMVREGRHLTMATSHSLSAMAERDFTGKPELNPTHMDFVYTYGPPGFIFDERCTIGIQHPKTWSIKLKKSLWRQTPGEGKGEYIIHDTTTSSLIFLHDLLALSHPAKLVGRRLQKFKAIPNWVYTSWHLGPNKEGIRVPWPFPPWLTMFECDLLRRSWIQVWRWFQEVKKGLISFDSGETDEAVRIHLCRAWIMIITRILAGPSVYGMIFERLRTSVNSTRLKKELKTIQAHGFPPEKEVLQSRLNKILTNEIGDYRGPENLEAEELVELIDVLKKAFTHTPKNTTEEEEVSTDGLPLYAEAFAETMKFLAPFKLFMLHSPRMIVHEIAVSRKNAERCRQISSSVSGELDETSDSLSRIEKNLIGTWIKFINGPESSTHPFPIKRIHERQEKIREVLNEQGESPLPPGFQNNIHTLSEHINQELILNESLENGWEPLIKEIVMLTKETTGQFERRRRIIRGWLADLACIFAPESGLDLFKDIAEILSNNKLMDKWAKPDIAHDIRRMRALPAVKFFDIGAIDRLHKLYAPKLRNMARPPHPNTDSGHSGNREDTINTIHNGLLCPIVEDITALSNLKKPFLVKYARQLKELVKQEPAPYETKVKSMTTPIRMRRIISPRMRRILKSLKKGGFVRFR